jgi:glycosyltransferase involved in cell wall biosynthesis
MWIGFLVKKLFGIPYVGYLHQPTTFIHRRPEIAGNWATKGDFLVMDSLLGVFGRDMALHLDRLCHLSADGLLFNSKYTRSCFKELYGVKGDVCYPAIDAPAQSLDISETEQSKHDGSTLITANRHYPWKRIDLSIRLLKLLPSGTRLIATGEHTAHTRALMRVAIDLDLADRVIFTGFVSDRRLAELYTMSDLYVQTSIREPFGLSPLEAQSLGLPAVVWADGGVQETVLHGRTGFHATPYDLKDFAYRALMILGDQDLRDRMSREARIWASSFTWDKHIDIVEQALRKAV